MCKFAPGCLRDSVISCSYNREASKLLGRSPHFRSDNNILLHVGLQNLGDNESCFYNG